MKKVTILAAAVTMASSLVAADLKTDDQKISYMIGSQMGETVAQNIAGPITLDNDAFFAGINDALAGKDAVLKPEEMEKLMKVFAQKADAFVQKKIAEESEQNAKESQMLLESNKDKDGVKVTDSGLQYRVITLGKGAQPGADDTVKVHYKGTLPDGSVFDSSYQRGEPVEFPLNAVIKGWTEGLQLMPVGSKFEFVIPAELAYGERAPASIGPNRALTFEVELLDIKK